MPPTPPYYHWGFQSTPPCGGDDMRDDADRKRVISIHAPLRGRQHSHWQLASSYKISIHAPLRGRLPVLANPSP